MRFSRVFAMPSADTFEVKPIGDFVRRNLHGRRVVLDPFARNNTHGTHTNDLNPETSATYHMDAEEFLMQMAKDGVVADAVLFDPPYSPRQISECYQSVGREVGMKDTQSALLYQRVRRAIIPVLSANGIVLSFGWNSVGMGIGHGFDIDEILLVCHGGAHNDTICMVERRITLPNQLFELCPHGSVAAELNGRKQPSTAQGGIHHGRNKETPPKASKQSARQGPPH